MISKMKPVEQGGSRLAIVFNGSPLFTGAAGSGESEIRRWIIENDWLEAVVALPDQLFYNTGISTYFWIVTNRKAPERRGKVQLVDARELFVEDAQEPRREAQGDQRRPDRRDHPPLRRLRRGRARSRSSPTRRSASCASPSSARCGCAGRSPTTRSPPSRPTRRLTKLDDDGPDDAAGRAARARIGLADTEPTAAAKLVDRRCCERRAQRQAAREGRAGQRSPSATPRRRADHRRARATLEPDPDLRDNENVPLPDQRVAFEADVDRPPRDHRVPQRRSTTTSTAEVLPYVPDAWVDHDKTKIGYEIPLTRHFYKYVPPRPLEEIDAEIKELEAEIQELLAEVTE